MKRLKLMGMGAAVMTGAASGAQGLPSYSVVEIPGLPGGDHINISGLNNRGEVLINHVAAGPLLMQATLWTALDGHRDLTGDGPYSYARDINDLGQVIGDQSWIWEPDGSMTALPSDVWLQQINNNSELFGVGYKPGTFREFPVLYSGGSVFNLPASTHLHYHISDANDRGVAVGWWSDVTGLDGRGHPIGDAAALVMTSSGVTEVPALPGARAASPAAINDTGMIIGSSHFDDAPDRATIWMPDGSMIDLGANIYINDVNDLGQVVGYSPDGPFLWSAERGMEMLLVPSGLPEYTSALAINDLGQIALRASVVYPERAFLLTPIPVPGECVLVMAAGFAAARRKR